MSSLIQSSGLTGFAFPNAKLFYSVSSGALTIDLKTADGNAISAANPIYGAFRASSSDGSLYEGRTIPSVVPVTVSNGSTLGDNGSSTPRKIWVTMFEDSGPVYRLAAINCRIPANNSIFSLVESIIASAVAEGGAGAADSAATFYAGTTITARPFRIVGSLTWETSAVIGGAWVAPDLKQMLGIGVKTPGQLVQDWDSLDPALIGGIASIIPLDNSLPLTSEGTSYKTITLTPSSGANILELTALINCSPDSADTVVCTLNRTGDSNSLVAGAQHIAAGALGQVSMRMRTLAGGLSGQNIVLRVGSNAGGGALGVTVNGIAGTSSLGTGLLSGHQVKEFVG
jgi:hypothetical protein